MVNDIQFDVAKLLLAKLRESGFVLAGGRALVELKLTNRPTRDLDLFTKQMDLANFEQSVDKAVAILVAAGYSVMQNQKTETFARLNVSSSNDMVIVEMGYDYREYDPIELEIGSVLDERDAILNKVSALYARSLPRDYIDVHFIRLSKRMSDDNILALSKERDQGFVLEYFSDALRRVKLISFEEFSKYGVSEGLFNDIKQTTLNWADEIDKDQ